MDRDLTPWHALQRSVAKALDTNRQVQDRRATATIASAAAAGNWLVRARQAPAPLNLPVR